MKEQRKLNENVIIFVKVNTFQYAICKVSAILFRPHNINKLKPRQNGCHFAEDIFKNENFRILNKISLKYVPYGLIDNMASLVQIMAWRWTGDKP